MRLVARGRKKKKLGKKRRRRSGEDRPAHCLQAAGKSPFASANSRKGHRSVNRSPLPPPPLIADPLVIALRRPRVHQGLLTSQRRGVAVTGHQAQSRVLSINQSSNRVTRLSPARSCVQVCVRVTRSRNAPAMYDMSSCVTADGCPCCESSYHGLRDFPTDGRATDRARERREREDRDSRFDG